MNNAKSRQKLNTQGREDPPPIFLMMPRKEEMHRMVIRATHFKTHKDINF
jgi:hypothetical protein